MSLRVDLFAELTLEELSESLHEDDRDALLRLFFERVEYKNAKEWNELVRVCECLAIVGFGDVTPVEARAERFVNGSFYTALSDRLFHKRYLSVGWCKRKATFVQSKSERYYYTSPDAEGIERDTRAYALAHPAVDENDYGISKLDSQRKRMARNPLRIIRSGNYNKSFEPFVKALEGLRHLLDEKTRPELYGDGFGHIGMTCAFSNAFGEYVHAEDDATLTPAKRFVRPRLKISRITQKEGESRVLVTRHFEEAFASLTLKEQKLALEKDLHEVLLKVAQKISRKGLEYKCAALIHDLERCLALWKNTTR